MRKIVMDVITYALLRKLRKVAVAARQVWYSVVKKN
jgi:hypothetical protein